MYSSFSNHKTTFERKEIESYQSSTRFYYGKENGRSSRENDHGEEFLIEFSRRKKNSFEENRVTNREESRSWMNMRCLRLCFPNFLLSEAWMFRRERMSEAFLFHSFCRALEAQMRAYSPIRKREEKKSNSEDGGRTSGISPI